MIDDINTAILATAAILYIIHMLYGKYCNGSINTQRTLCSTLIGKKSRHNFHLVKILVTYQL